MNARRINGAWAAIATIALTALTLTACTSMPLSAQSRGRIGNVVFCIYFDNNGGSTFGANDSQNRCFEIKFYDDHGNELGSGTIQGGTGSGAVPTGATRWQAKEVECPPPGSLVAPAGGATKVLVIGAPLWLDSNSPNHNALFEMFVICDPTTSEAFDVARKVTESPIGTPVPPNVSIEFLAEVFEGATSAAVVSVAQGRFADFRLDANGAVGYADLASSTNAVQSIAGPDVYVVTTIVPYAIVHGQNEWNHVVVDQRRSGQLVPTHVEYNLVHY